ncbi:FKBP-type peptidyl-prolyl cis-trans isomerase [Rhabdobacter roseus]|uniref:Peptidyl-prolyl cis-trans isomerase n=1 Tax=Rhabdobacter roseus TaxID=1655419 RepID=A0A840TI89_9BACT|nr:FKBP-type peptidyl-prolyl cis-trans isomerase [Rhabdobacter roseus]MBB5283184.1 FKBP-type peptidyl-prolyl cis-trans isomerase SlyD [Rhabdobacter roseus]
MKIEKNKVVVLAYNLSIPDQDGEMDLVETVNDSEPMAFIFGHSGLPDGFEVELDGLSAGDTFDFTIDPEGGYGEFDPEAVVELPKDIFQVDDVDQAELLEIGNMIPMTNEEGERLQGQVVEVKDDVVVMDFNHPLAGKAMHFEGRVLSVRDATPEELDHGHVHGQGGVDH